MTKSLTDAIIRVQELATVAGMKTAPNYPTESIIVKPFSIAYPGMGEIGKDDATSSRDIHRIYCQLHWTRAMLAESVEAALALFASFIEELRSDETLNGSVDAIIWPVTYQFGELGWDEEATVGWQFEIPVKIRKAL